MSMRVGKWIKKIVMFLMTSILLIGCGQEQRAQQEKTKEHTEYNIDSVKLFDVDEDMNICALGDDNNLRILNSDGDVVKQIPIETKECLDLCADKDSIFFLTLETSMDNPYGQLNLRELNLSDESFNTIFCDETAYSAKSLCKFQHLLFFITCNLEDENENQSDSTAQYLDCGERLICFDENTKTYEIISLDNIKLISKKSEDELWIFAFDLDIRMYYFASFYITDRTISEKHYVGTDFNPYLQDFAYDSDIDKIIVPDFMSNQVIQAYDPIDLKSGIGLYKAGYGLSGKQICCVEGWSYYLADDHIHRIKNKDYWKETKSIIVYTSTYDYQLPGDSGYLMHYEHIDEEQMAMAVMSGSSDYDILLLDTGSPIADNIRRIGAYEPLNSMDMVGRYFENSFDYIKEAATDSNGAIWMLPCDLSVDVLVYQPELCSKYGLLESAPITNQSLWEAEKKLRKLEQEGQEVYYSYNYGRDGLSRQIQLYLRDYAYRDGKVLFDTTVFRNICETLKEELNGDAQTYYNNSLAAVNTGLKYDATPEEEEEHYRDYFSNVAFVCADRHLLSCEYKNRVDSKPTSLLNFDFFEVQEMPGLENANEASVATAYILVVNPKSEHLEEVKDYVAYLAETLSEKESIYLTKTLEGEYNENERKVHDIYAAGRIVFEYPDDVFWNDILEYLNGKDSYQNMIAEIERKLNLYLKE